MALRDGQLADATDLTKGLDATDVPADDSADAWTAYVSGRRANHDAALALMRQVCLAVTCPWLQQPEFRAVVDGVTVDAFAHHDGSRLSDLPTRTSSYATTVWHSRLTLSARPIART